MRKLLLCLSLLCAPVFGQIVTVSTTSGGAGTVEPANYVLAGPTSGGSAASSYRPLVSVDIPVIPDTDINLSTPLQGQSYQSGLNQTFSSDIYTMTPTAGQVAINTSGTLMTFSLYPTQINSNNASTSPSAPTNYYSQYVCVDSANCIQDIDDFGGSFVLLGRRWDGTNASKTAVQAAEAGNTFAARFYDGTSMPTSDEVYCSLITAQIQTSTHHGAGMDCYTTPNNTTTAQKSFREDASGGIEMYLNGVAPTGTDPGSGSINFGAAPQINGVAVPSISSSNTLTNKTMDGGSNTFTNLPVTALAASGTTGGGSISGAQAVIWPYYAEDRILMMVPSSGSFANNGVLTLTTALQSGMCTSARPGGGCYMSFPANAIATGTPSTDTAYWTVCTTTTACTVFNNAYSGSGVPVAVGSPTAFVTTGPGAYTQTTTAITLMQLTVPANSMGTNGKLDVDAVTIQNNSGNNKTARLNFGGTQFAQFTATTSALAFFEMSIWNCGATNNQVSSSFVLGQSSTGAMSYGTIDTTANRTLSFIIVDGTATDYMGWQVANVKVVQ